MNKKFIRLLALALTVMMVLSTVGCANYKAGKYVEVYETTGTKSRLLTRSDDLESVDYDENSSNVSVTVDVKAKKQNVYGMGAAMTHSSAYLLNEAGDEVRAEVLNDLFSADGAGFNFVRVPMGTSDYTYGDFYTLCDLEDNTASDENLEHFSVEKDAVLIKILKEVVAINPDVLLIAVPWSAPAWMKENHSLIGGRLSERYNSVFADYLVKFVQAYAAEGINFSYISLINEPYIANVGYPSMNMDGAQTAAITEILGGKLKSAKLKDVKIMAYDHNYSARDAVKVEQYVDQVLENKNVSQYISGIAFHGYGNNGFEDFKGGMDYVNEYYSGKETYITEITEHDGSVDFASNISYGLKNVLINPVNNGLSGAMYWNYVLTSDGKPVNGNNAVCFGLISLDKVGEEYVYTKNAGYYALSHLQKYSQKVKGKYAVALETESSNPGKIIACAVLRGDGAAVVNVHNTSDATSEDVDVVVKGKSVTVRLQPQSVITLVF